jgi:dephospho-CoA kinase
MAFVLGLTGGIATGKSTVANVFREYGFPVIDGDIVSRQIVAKGQPALQQLIQTFGAQIRNADGSLNRKQLGAIVFADSKKRQYLDQIMEPYLRSAISAQIAEAKATAPLVVVDLPLLFEGHYESEMNEIAVVYLPEALQLQRLMTRNQLTEEQALQRIASQMPVSEKKARADIVFDNQGSLAETQKQVTDWLKQKQFIH